MKSCAIVLMCLIVLAGSLSVTRADSLITQHEQVTVLVQDKAHGILGSRTFSYDSTSAPAPAQPGPLSLWFTLGYDLRPGKTLFSNIPLVSDIGKTVWVTSTRGNPAYSTFVTSLLDGRDDPLSGTFSLKSSLGVVSTDTIRLYDSNLISGLTKKVARKRGISGIGIRVDNVKVLQTPVAVSTVPEPYPGVIVFLGLTSTAVMWRKRLRL